MLTGLISTVSSGQNKSAPKLFLENNYFDAGEVKQGSVINHVFKIKNNGDAPLEISSVKPT